MIADRSIPSSQAITPYGPGAILDWGQECFVVIGVGKDNNPGWEASRTINLPRLEELLGVEEGFKLPPNRERSGGHSNKLDKLLVKRFPAWLFCPRCRRMKKWGSGDEKGLLPKCKGESCDETVLAPMRYVAACSNGHLTDIQWGRWVHLVSEGVATPCDPEIHKNELEYKAREGRGVSLSGLEVRCRICGRSRTMKELEGGPLGQKCFGTQPWQYDSQAKCEEPLEVLLRSSTAAHFPIIVSALDIRVSDKWHEREAAIESVIRPKRDFYSKADLLKIVDSLAAAATAQLTGVFPGKKNQGGIISPDEVKRYLLGGADDSDPIEGEEHLLKDEWVALTTPTPDRSHNAPLIVQEESMGDEAKGLGLEQFIDGIFLIERLREVRAFKGFYRLDGSEMVPPDCGEILPVTEDIPWLPAVEVFGEGIFLRFSPGKIKEWEKKNKAVSDARRQAIEAAIENDERLKSRYESRFCVFARYVMVHTFAHILIRQLCYESGYHSASLRERIYVFGGNAGVLIYTAEGDSAGSLGGLVRQGRAGRLEKTILSALERAQWCSNDPICNELPPHGPGTSNRAACHACVLLPETSCSEFNGLLDRQFVVGDGAKPVGNLNGYFKSLMKKVVP